MVAGHRVQFGGSVTSQPQPSVESHQLRYMVRRASVGMRAALAAG
jgi:hypothetical protein